MTTPVVFLLTFAACSSTPRAAPAAGFRIVTVDGAEIDVASLTIGGDGSVRLSPEPSAAVVRRLDDLFRVTPTRSDRPAPVPPSEFLLADGGTLRGRLVEAQRGASPGGAPARERAVLAEVGLGDPVPLPFEALAAIRIASKKTPETVPAEDERSFRERLERRDATRDVLIALGPDGPSVWPGALESLTPSGWAFRVGGRTHRGGLERLYGVVLAAASPTPVRPARIRLACGGDFSAAVLGGDASCLRVLASFGAELSLPWTRIERVDLTSGRVRYLSDLAPAKIESRGFFGHRWPIRTDRSLTGDALRVGERTFSKGLAVHAYSRVSYTLGDEYDRFAAAIGLDARQPFEGAVPLEGHAVFRVLGDERVLYNSGPVRAGSPPKEMNIDVRGVRTLALELDFGDDLDLGDRGVWGDARLVRP